MATLTITPIKTFVSGEIVDPAKLNKLSQSAVALTAGTVTVADLATATVERLLPAGAVMSFAMNSAPSGWIAANGAAVERAGTYAVLFAAIGTTHGVGDGSTTFNLPDLRGYFVRGFGTNGDLVASQTFATKQAAAMLNHAHQVFGSTTTESATHTHAQTGTFDLNSQAVLAGGGGANITTGGGGYGPVATPAVTISGQTGTQSASHFHSINFNSGNPTVGGGTETRPANIALLYCIKF